MLLVALLWLSLLNPSRADHLVDSLAGPQHEYKIVLGGALLAYSILLRSRDSRFQVVVSGSGPVLGDAGIFHLQSVGLATRGAKKGTLEWRASSQVGRSF
jgi:hypothetical protein